jgi:dephospho-CoA kinase
MSALPIIGVTGATGAGKGIVCEVLSGMGAFVIDTDKIAHAIILKGQPAYNEIIEAFKNETDTFLDDNGEIIRRRLSELVFADDLKLKKLTEITHKHIIQSTLNQIDEIQNSTGQHKFIVIDAPLLIESGLSAHCTKIIGVIANDETRIERIIKRDGLTVEQAQLRAKKQTPLDVLREHTDFIIENNGSTEDLTNVIKLAAEKSVNFLQNLVYT